MDYENSTKDQYLNHQFDPLLEVKQQIAKSLSYAERIEILKYLENLDKCDIIGKLPMPLAARILRLLLPEELVSLRLVSRTWNKKITHDSVWRPICIEYSIIPDPTSASICWNSSLPIYHDLFQRSLTMAKNWKTMKCKRIELKYHTGPILSMVIANPTRLFTGDIDGKIHVWDAQNECYVTYIGAHENHVSCLAHSARYLASGSADTTIGVHDMKTLRQISRLRGHEGPVTALSFMKNNNSILFSGSTDRTIRVWNTDTNSCIRILHGQENTISSIIHCTGFPSTYCQSEMELESVDKNRAGYLVTGSSDRNIFLWDLKTSIFTDEPDVINTIMEAKGPISALAVYDESLARSSKNISTFNNYYTYSRQPINIPTFVVYSALPDATVTLYSLPAFERTFVETPNIHRSTIWSISPAIIHSKLITTSGDRTAIVWDLKTPKSSITLAGFDSAVVSSAISPQEEFVCFGTEKGTIVLFDMMEPSS